MTAHIPSPQASMTDYEKAMLIIQVAQLELLQVIAWNGGDCAARDQDRVKKVPETVIKSMARECPSVLEVIKR